MVIKVTCLAQTCLPVAMADEIEGEPKPRISIWKRDLNLH